MNSNQREELRVRCEEQGYSFEITRWPKRLTYYKKDGEAMHGLPSDPVTMIRYFNKGFTLTPPNLAFGVDDQEAENREPEEQVPQVTCPHCGFEAKSPWGLQSHMKVHEGKTKKEVGT